MTTGSETALNNLRGICWDEALQCYGTAYIFERRARLYLGGIRLIQYLSLFIPIFIGSFVLTFGITFKRINSLLFILGILAILQVVVTLWALIHRWEDKYAYSLKSTSDNYRLSGSFSDSAKNPPDLAVFRHQLTILQTENNYRSHDDIRQNITDKEKRRGLRAGLRQYRRECVECEQIPKSMKATKCPVCGTF